MRVVAIDLSLTGTGVAVIPDLYEPVQPIQVTTIKTDPKNFPKTLQGHIRRVEYIIEEIDIFADFEHGDMLLIEGLSMHSKSSSLDKIIGGWWLAIDRFGEHVLEEPVVIPPTNIKQYATGNGNAKKEDVLLAVARRYPDVAVSNNNEADALALASMGARRLGSPIEGKLPAKNLDAMVKIEWGPWIEDLVHEL